MTKKELQNYKWLIAEMRFDREKLAELKSQEAGKGVSYDSIGSSGQIGNPTASLACKVAELEQRISHNEGQIQAILQGIDGITDVKLRLAIRLHYIEDMKLTQIAKEFGGSLSTLREQINKLLV